MTGWAGCRAVVVVSMWLAVMFDARATAPAVAHIETRGEGETTLVLLHNAQGDWPVWRSFMERHHDRYTMHAVRLAGYGGSEPMPLPLGDPLDETPWTDAAVTELIGWLEGEGIENAVAIGHGLGGLIAMRLGIESPERVAGVIAVDTMPAHPLILDGMPLTPIERATTVSNGFLKNVRGTDESQWRARWREVSVRQTRDETEHEMLRAVVDELNFTAWRRWKIEQYLPDLSEALRDSETRVLAAAAVNSGMLRIMGSRVMVEELWRLTLDELPGVTVTFYDDARHYLFLDYPDQFDAMVARFVAGEEQPAYSRRLGDDPVDP